MKKLTGPYLADRVICDQVGKLRDGSGNFRFRTGYYYRHGQDASTHASYISKQLSDLNLDHEVVDKGDHWAPFRGGSSVAQGSHFWVVVKFK